MDNVEEAQRLINIIRRERRVDQDGPTDANGRDLERSLKLLSEALYSTSTRFILELIQNADDNKYEDCTPSLKVIYRDGGYLWIGCNEVGFTESNVRAICSIGDSTKTIQQSRKGYIGEKGIGFKSVFTVADLVWIRSGALEFRFDKTKKLGMIAPEWCTFLEHPGLSTYRTRFCFRIPVAEKRNEVRHDLLGLKPELLLFLRQLMAISVSIEDANAMPTTNYQLKRDNSQYRGFTMIRLGRTDLQATTPTSTVKRYIIRTIVVRDMPAEELRPGISESDVVLAFPVDENYTPIIEDQPTFNFLPIRAYGLPFVLHGDFLLTASREDILHGKQWNQHLAGSVVGCFHQCVVDFNARDVLTYTWPRYVASQGNPHGSIFRNFFVDLVNSLRLKDVIMSQALPTLRAPSRLSYVPPVFRWEDKHLFDDLSDSMNYASHRYSPADLANLRIQCQSGVEFVRLLQRDIRDNPSGFRQRSVGWHTKLAEAIIYTGRYNDVRHLNIIPLRDGDWTNAQRNVYFPELQEGGNAVPCGVSVAIIDESAVTVRSRKMLYQRLGALQLTSAELYKLVVDQHKDHGGQYGNWTRDIVVAHAWFLFCSPTRPADGHLNDLWMASSNSQLLHKGQHLYMDVPESGFRVSDYLSHQDVHYVDDSYLEHAPANRTQPWLTWLQQQLGVRTRPKLSSSGHISDEFKIIITRSTANDWLLLLKNQYRYYASSITRLQTQLARQAVRCFDGRYHEVCKVYLETPTVNAESVPRTWVPTLHVEDSADPLWQNMTVIGLRMRPDLEFYVTSLTKLKENWSVSSSLSAVRRMYNGISQYFEENPDYVRQAFNSENLVYLYAEQRWAAFSECRWRSPRILTTLYALSSRYEELQRLWVSQLGMSNATMNDIVQELNRLSGQQQRHDTIKELLLLLPRYLKLESDHSQLRTHWRSDPKVFPIRTTSGLHLRSFSENYWFINDRQRLGSRFEGHVALLDFTLPEIEKLMPLLQALRLSNRTLSATFKGESQASGESMYDFTLTQQLRSKAHHIARLAAPARYHTVRNRMLAIQVYCNTNLVLRRFVLVNNSPVYGDDEEGYLVLSDREPNLVLYVSTQVAQASTLPPVQLAELVLPTLVIVEEKRTLLVMILGTPFDEAIEDALEKANIAPCPDARSSALVQSSDNEESNPDDDSVNGATYTPSETSNPIFGSTNTNNLFGSTNPNNPFNSPNSNNLFNSPNANSLFGSTSPTPVPNGRASSSHGLLTPSRSPASSVLSTGAQSTSSRSSRRRSNMRSQTPCTVINEATIRASAGAYDVHHTSIIGSSVLARIAGRSDYHELEATVDSTAAPRTSAVQTDAASSGARNGSTSATNRSIFDMSSIGDALESVRPTAQNSAAATSGRSPRAMPYTGSPAARRSRDHPESTTEELTHTPRDHGDAIQQEIGYGGELFVYHFLKENFQADDECWTSNMRSRAGLSRFQGREGDHADFTITDRAIVAKVTDWLVEAGNVEALRSWDSNATYHFEVKTTLGPQEEPFMMSNNQFSMSRRWHGSVLDVYVVLRVYNLNSSPAFRAYIDPFGLWLAGRLNFTAQGGYCVQPA